MRERERLRPFNEYDTIIAINSINIMYYNRLISIYHVLKIQINIPTTAASDISIIRTSASSIRWLACGLIHVLHG